MPNRSLISNRRIEREDLPRVLARRWLRLVYESRLVLRRNSTQDPRLTVRVQTWGARITFITTLTCTSTYQDLYDEVRRELGLPLRATAISLLLCFHSSTERPDTATWAPGESGQPRRAPGLGAVRGCLFDVIVHT